MNEKKVVLQKLSSKVAEKQTENSDLESQLNTLDFAISERNKILSLQSKFFAEEFVMMIMMMANNDNYDNDDPVCS